MMGGKSSSFYKPEAKAGTFAGLAARDPRALQGGANGHCVKASAFTYLCHKNVTLQTVVLVFAWN
jgi:hypothetical protein